MTQFQCLFVLNALQVQKYSRGIAQSYNSMLYTKLYSVPRYIANFCSRQILALKRGWKYNKVQAYNKRSSYNLYKEFIFFKKREGGGVVYIICFALFKRLVSLYLLTAQIIPVCIMCNLTCNLKVLIRNGCLFSTVVDELHSEI